MAKSNKSSLPKIISKANRDISIIIDNDIAKESEILKNLVDQVLAANLEVKKKNNQRITETKRKLAELDTEIDELNISIDLVDRETVLEQLNEMIDAENKIFTARQEIRFFENEHTEGRINELDNIYQHLTSSIQNIKSSEFAFRELLQDGNDMLFNKQISITNEIIQLMTDVFKTKKEYAVSKIDESNEIKERIAVLENEFMTFINANLDTCKQLSSDSASIFIDEDNELFISEKIQMDYDKTMEEINQKIAQIEEKHLIKKDELLNTYLNFENGIRAKLKSDNQKAIDEEMRVATKKDEELRQIRLLIIDAEKNQDIGKVQSLMKRFEKIEKSRQTKALDKTAKMLEQMTKKTKDKTKLQLKALSLKRVSDLHKLELALALERVKFQESKILYKIKSDRDALLSDNSINKLRIENLQAFLNEKIRVTKDISQVKLELRIAELNLLKENEIRELELFSTFKELLSQLKDIEHKRLLKLKEHINNHNLIKIEQQFHVDKAVQDILLEQELSNIDKLILKKRNESLIRVEKLKEDANSEIIYQESLIKIAQKEHELQLIKVKSLYENERSLAEEQVERINLGIQVNDAFVKTTLENQLLFASQQIQCAKSEYDIRVESVMLTKEQELAYANKKIDYYRQKYEYEKSKIRKELDDKLEDLNYKLLLFTDKKENEEIQHQIDNLTNRFQKMIDDIQVIEDKDEEIKRYQKVIEAAELRAEKAVNEAQALREQTTTAFEALYNQTKEKYSLIESSTHSEDTVGIMPLINSNAISSADERLQQAIKEADELYKERITGPNNEIAARKKDLEELSVDEETEMFIQEQKELKKNKILLYNEAILLLQEQREKATEIAKEDSNRARLIQEKQLEEEREKQFDKDDYRSKEEIIKDYAELEGKERRLILKHITDAQEFSNERLLEHKKIMKEINNLIKQSLKPYKKYIRFASKGLNAEKKEITKEYKKRLRKALNEAESGFISEI